MATRPKFQFALLATLIAIAFPAFAAPLEDQLVTRTYKLDIAKIQKLSETTLAELAPPPTNSPSNLLRALFAHDGITFPTNLTTTNVDSLKSEKAFYFNEQSGELRLRATRRDIPKFEKHLAQLSPDATRTETEFIRTTFTTVGAWIEIVPDVTPPAHLLTLNPTPIFTNLNSLDDFTNPPVLTTKTYPRILPSSTKFVSITSTQPTTVQYLRVRSPVTLDQPPIILQTAVPLSAHDGTLIIRADSDLQ
jgi:hypothetical protein